MLDLLQNYNPESQEFTNQILSIKESDPKGYFSSLIDISMSDIDSKVRIISLVLMLQCIPNQEDISEIHIFDLYGSELMKKLVESMFSLLESFPVNNKNYPSSVLCKILPIYFHSIFENDIIDRLCQMFTNCYEEKTLYNIGNILISILESYSPNDEEVQMIVSAVFSHFVNLENIGATCMCLNVLVSLLENVSELLLEENVISSVGNILLALLEIPSSALNCIICIQKFKSFCPQFLSVYEDPFIYLVCMAIKNAHDSDNVDIIREGFVLIRKFAKLELLDRKLEMKAVTTHSCVISLQIIQTLCMRQNKQCPDLEEWEHYTAAYEALKYVVILNGDGVNDILISNTSDLLKSELFNERYAGLQVLSVVITTRKNLEWVFMFLNHIKSLIGDEAPCICQMALRCLRKSIGSIVQSPDFDKNKELRNKAAEIASSTIDLHRFLQHESPQISFETVKLFRDTILVPGFQGGSELINHIMTIISHFHDRFHKNPFEVLNDIINSASFELVSPVFENMLDILVQAVANTGTEWVMSQLCETFECFCYREDFFATVSSKMQELFDIFDAIIRGKSAYKASAIRPLAALCRANMELFIPKLGYVLEVLTNLVQMRDYPDMIYNVCIAVDMILQSGVTLEDYSFWTEVSVEIIKDMNTLPMPRFAAVKLLSKISSLSPKIVSEYLESLHEIFTAISVTLDIMHEADKVEAEMIAIHIIKTYKHCFTFMGFENSSPFLRNALSFVTFFGKYMPTFKMNFLDIVELSLIFADWIPNDLLNVLHSAKAGNNEGLSVVFTTAAGVDSNYPVDDENLNSKGKLLLKKLHYDGFRETT